MMTPLTWQREKRAQSSNTCDKRLRCNDIEHLIGAGGKNECLTGGALWLAQALELQLRQSSDSHQVPHNSILSHPI